MAQRLRYAGHFATLQCAWYSHGIPDTLEQDGSCAAWCNKCAVQMSRALKATAGGILPSHPLLRTRMPPHTDIHTDHTYVYNQCSTCQDWRHFLLYQLACSDMQCPLLFSMSVAGSRV